MSGVRALLDDAAETAERLLGELNDIATLAADEETPTTAARLGHLRALADNLLNTIHRQRETLRRG